MRSDPASPLRRRRRRRAGAPSSARRRPRSPGRTAAARRGGTSHPRLARSRRGRRSRRRNGFDLALHLGQQLGREVAAQQAHVALASSRSNAASGSRTSGLPRASPASVRRCGCRSPLQVLGHPHALGDRKARTPEVNHVAAGARRRRGLDPGLVAWRGSSWRESGCDRTSRTRRTGCSPSSSPRWAASSPRCAGKPCDCWRPAARRTSGCAC